MKDTIEKLLIMVSMLATVLAAGPANADLVAHWRFDETSGTTAHDSSGNGYHAAAVEGTPIWDSNGRQGGCLNFDATYGMSIPTEAFEDINEAISISMWVNYHPNQPDNATVLFQAGTDVNQKHSFIVSVRTKWRDDELEFETGYEEESSETWGDAKLNDRAGRWDHYVFVTDTTESFQGIYHNGLRVAGGSDSNPMPGITRAHIGLATDRVHDQQRARIDDVRIYNHGLSTEEVNQLYSLRPKLMKLGEAVQKGEATLNQKGPREAMLFLENKLAEAEKWRQEDPAADTSSFKELLFDLNFLLAKAKQGAGRPQRDVEAAYRRASKHGVPSRWRCSSVLLWLQENGKTAEHERIACSIDEKSLDYFMQEVIAKAERMIEGQRQHEAIGFLETNLAIYTTWKKKHPPDDVLVAPRLADAYFHLAKAREAVGAPKKDIAAAYGKAFGSSAIEVEDLGSEQERAAALIWLVNNGFTDDYIRAVKSFSQARQITDNVEEIVESVCEDFESRKDWAAFEGLLDALFTAEKYPIEWATFVESCLSSEKNRWARKYFSHVDSKPRLKFGRDCGLAQKHLADEDFEEAAELYRQIINRCGPEDDKGFYQFQLCRSLFQAARPADALPQLDSFLANYHTSHPKFAREAVLMKARLYLLSRRLDEALVQFQTAAEYPDTEQACEAAFFMAYCTMLKGELAAATQALNAVAENYPETQWARRARLCLAHIKNIGAKETVAN
jgi:hypothetical protein